MTSKLVGIVAVFIAGQLAGGDGNPPTPTPFAEHIEVRVRQVLVTATDKHGKPVPALLPSDLEITEDGTSVEILGVESLRPGLPESDKRSSSPRPGAQGAASALAIPQYLYLDTAVINRRSVSTLSDAVASNLGAVLRNGPLEIVVADPEPRTLIPSTNDAISLRKAIELLPKTATGKERLLTIRRDTVQEMNDLRANKSRANSSAKAGAVRSELRAAVRAEVTLIQDSLERLQSWAATLPGDRASVLYLTNDGFDSDPTEVYRDTIFGDEETSREVRDLAQEFGGTIPRLIADTSADLAGRGLTTIVLAVGGTSAEFAGSAAAIDTRGGLAMRRPTDNSPVFYYVRPFEQLRIMANDTGGELVSSSAHFDDAVARVGGAFLVTFRPAATRKLGRNVLDVQSRRADLVVRAPKTDLTGTPALLALSQTIRALSSSPDVGTLPVAASIEQVARASNSLLGGRLMVKADLTQLAGSLEHIGAPHMRVTLAVEVDGARPFTRQDEMDVRRSGTGGVWTYQVPLSWPTQAKRIAVGVEELQTNTRGLTVIPLPSAP